VRLGRTSDARARPRNHEISALGGRTANAPRVTSRCSKPDEASRSKQSGRCRRSRLPHRHFCSPSSLTATSVTKRASGSSLPGLRPVAPRSSRSSGSAPERSSTAKDFKPPAPRPVSPTPLPHQLERKPVSAQNRAERIDRAVQAIGGGSHLPAAYLLWIGVLMLFIVADAIAYSATP